MDFTVSFVSSIISLCIVAILYSAIIYCISKNTNSAHNDHSKLIEEIKNQSDLLKEQNDLLKKILSESLDEEKQELSKKLQQVNDILNN